MLFDLDSLLGDARRRSVKWRWLSRVFDPRLLPDEYALEIAVFVNTPGITPHNVRGLMYWNLGFYNKIVEPAIAGIPHDLVMFHAERNAASVTAEDARDMLIALGRRKDRTGGLPIYATMWLQEQWRAGRTHKEIAEELGTSLSSVSRWIHDHGFVADRWLN